MNFYLKIIFVLFILTIVCVLFLILRSNEDETTLHQILHPEYYGDKFDESLFPPQNNNIPYLEKTKKGYEILRNKNIVVLGLAYNLGKEGTYRLLRRLSYIVKLCNDYRVIIYAFDSEDSTYDILRANNKNGKLILPKKKINKANLNRTQKMSKLRNILCQELTNLEGFSPDYVLLQDCDLASAISLDGLANSIYYLEKEKYHAIFANGITNEFLFNCHVPFLGYYYYDSFAFTPHPKYPILGGNKAICNTRGDKPFPVISAFGGAALYNYNVFKQFKYSEKNKYICEHKNLNKQIYKNGYKLAINPSFILISGRQGEKKHKSIKK